MNVVVLCDARSEDVIVVKKHAVGREQVLDCMSADDLVLMAKEETVLQGMIDRLIEIGRCYGMEMNVEKTKVMRTSRQPTPVTIKIG
jgi:hypothetical protein